MVNGETHHVPEGKVAIASNFQKSASFESVSINTGGGISKASMIHNHATPDIKVDTETYAMPADDELLVCELAKELPMAPRYFLF